MLDRGGGSVTGSWVLPVPASAHFAYLTLQSELVRRQVRRTASGLIARGGLPFAALGLQVPDVRSVVAGFLLQYQNVDHRCVECETFFQLGAVRDQLGVRFLQLLQ